MNTSSLEIETLHIYILLSKLITVKKIKSAENLDLALYFF